VFAGFTDLLSQVCVNPAANSAYSELTGAIFLTSPSRNGGGNNGIQSLMMFDDV